MATQDVLDAEVAQALEGNPVATFDWGGFDVEDVPALRASLSAPPSPDPPPPAAAWADHQAPGWGDDPDVTLRVFGTRDVRRDETIEYGRRLMEAGVPTELHVYPGVPHGFEIFAPKARLSVRFEGDIDDALGRAWSARP